MSNSLQLDSDPTSATFWDLSLVPSTGGLSLTVTRGNAALAQNVATALDTHLGEVWYDTTLGMPYLQQIFGRGRVPLAFVKSKILAIAQKVPGVASAVVFLTGPTAARTLGGQVQIRAPTGSVVAVIGSTNLSGALPWYVAGATMTNVGNQLTGSGLPLTGGGVPLTGGV